MQAIRVAARILSARDRFVPAGGVPLDKSLPVFGGVVGGVLRRRCDGFRGVDLGLLVGLRRWGQGLRRRHVGRPVELRAE